MWFVAFLFLTATSAESISRASGGPIYKEINVGNGKINLETCSFANGFNLDETSSIHSLIITKDDFNARCVPFSYVDVRVDEKHSNLATKFAFSGKKWQKFTCDKESVVLPSCEGKIQGFDCTGKDQNISITGFKKVNNYKFKVTWNKKNCIIGTYFLT